MASLLPMHGTRCGLPCVACAAMGKTSVDRCADLDCHSLHHSVHLCLDHIGDLDSFDEALSALTSTLVKGVMERGPLRLVLDIEAAYELLPLLDNPLLIGFTPAWAPKASSRWCPLPPLCPPSSRSFPADDAFEEDEEEDPEEGGDSESGAIRAGTALQVTFAGRDHLRRTRSVSGVAGGSSSSKADWSFGAGSSTKNCHSKSSAPAPPTASSRPGGTRPRTNPRVILIGGATVAKLHLELGF